MKPIEGMIFIAVQQDRAKKVAYISEHELHRSIDSVTKDIADAQIEDVELVLKVDMGAGTTEDVTEIVARRIGTVSFTEHEEPCKPVRDFLDHCNVPYFQQPDDPFWDGVDRAMLRRKDRLTEDV